MDDGEVVADTRGERHIGIRSDSYPEIEFTYAPSILWRPKVPDDPTDCSLISCGLFDPTTQAEDGTKYLESPWRKGEVRDTYRVWRSLESLETRVDQLIPKTKRLSAEQGHSDLNIESWPHYNPDSKLHYSTHLQKPDRGGTYHNIHNVAHFHEAYRRAVRRGDKPLADRLKEELDTLDDAMKARRKLVGRASCYFCYSSFATDSSLPSSADTKLYDVLDAMDRELYHLELLKNTKASKYDPYLRSVPHVATITPGFSHLRDMHPNYGIEEVHTVYVWCDLFAEVQTKTHLSEFHPVIRTIHPNLFDALEWSHGEYWWALEMARAGLGLPSDPEAPEEEAEAGVRRCSSTYCVTSAICSSTAARSSTLRHCHSLIHSYKRILTWRRPKQQSVPTRKREAASALSCAAEARNRYCIGGGEAMATMAAKALHIGSRRAQSRLALSSIGRTLHLVRSGKGMRTRRRGGRRQ